MAASPISVAARRRGWLSCCGVYFAPAMVAMSSFDELLPSENSDDSRLDDLAARLEPVPLSLSRPLEDAALPIDSLRRSEWDRLIVEGEFDLELSAEWPSVGRADSGESEGDPSAVAGDRFRDTRRLLAEIRTRSLAGAAVPAGDSGRGSTLPCVASWMLLRLAERVGTIGWKPGTGFGLLGRLPTVLFELFVLGS